ncbi:WD40 repeat [Macleaya cordata]|uniref:WD40 repeat n=1 Tax=Macleaya cordata TaxID=56857 RepID=A0A200QYC8_MACCD|nr:WD40 repeat [Macleaya cordata]
MITGGKSFVSSPPAFSSDGKKLLVCTGNTVSVFSTSTGMQITELEGHKATVTSVIVVQAPTPASKILCYCWTSSLDGTICYWDFSIPELIKKVDVKLQIFSMVIPNLPGLPIESSGKPSDAFAFLSVEDINTPDDQSNALHGKIWKCNLTKSSLVGGVLAETKHPEFITISTSREFFGIRNKRKVYIWKIFAKDSKYDVKKIKLHHTKNLSVLAFHPTEKIIAAGDVTGRILIWRGFGKKTFSGGHTDGKLVKNEEERPGVRGDDDAESCSTWHWHPSEVKVLSFSSDGAYLYSGGIEGVLVVWQLDTGKKKFLPRIGSPLLYFTQSLDPSLSSISCADNQIHLLKMPSMEVLKSIAGIKLPSLPEVNEGLCSGIVFDRSAGLVAIRMETYCIQFYSLFDDREISQVQVCERNHQPGDDITLIVTLLALSMDGTKMSTAEVKHSEDGIGGLVCLRFWESGPRRGAFILSTIIYEPHSDAGISALAFHPTRDMAVSTSYGGDFKIWVQSYNTQQKDQVPQKSGWRCNSVGSYKEKPMTAAAFSADGSVLAVAAENVVTLWDPDKNVLVAVIGEMLTRIVSLSFVGKSEYLVSVSRGSKPHLSVWSTSSLSMSWSYNLFIEAVTCNMDGSCFAVLALNPKSSKQAASDNAALQGRDGVILLFSVEDPVPLATWTVKKAKGGGISFLQADPSSLDKKASDGKEPSEVLVYVSGDHEYIIFDPYNKEDSIVSGYRRESVVPVEETGKSGYASIYGELPQIGAKRDQNTRVPFVPSERPWETIFSGSSHILPPLTKLCSVFLESFLERRQTVEE